MIGRMIGGWAIVGVLGEEDQLHRYRVEQAGTTATMEVAAAGSPAAASMTTRRDPQIIARGTDTFGNAYVVLGDAAPPRAVTPQPQPSAPAPIPRIAAAQQKSHTKLVLIVLAALVGVFVLVSIVRKVGKSAPKPAAVSLRPLGSWGYKCGAPYTLTIMPGRRATVTMLGKQYPASVEDGAVIELPADTKPGTTIEATAEAPDGGTGRVTARVAERPAQPPLSNGWVSGLSAYSTKVAIVTGGTSDEVRIEKSSNDSTDTPHVELAFDACGVKPQTSERDGVKLTSTGERVRVAIELPEVYWNAITDDKPVVTAPLELENGKQVELRIALTVYRAPKDTFARLAKVPKQPLADAPLPSDVTTTPKPIAVLWDGDLDRKLLGAVPVSKAPYVAHVVTGQQGAGSCGPYGYQYLSYRRFRTTATAKLYEARTGKLIGQKSFVGGSPGSCPQTVYARNDKVDDDYGSSPTEAVETWLKSAAR